MSTPEAEWQNVDFSWSTIAEMLDHIGLTPADQADVIKNYDPAKIQRHAAQTIYCMERPDSVMRSPVAWFKASIRANWNPPPGFDAKQTIMHFRIDERTWAEMEIEMPCPICGAPHKQMQCPRRLSAGGAT